MSTTTTLLALLTIATPVLAQVPASPFVPLPRDTVLWAAIIAAEDARADDMRSLAPIVKGIQHADPFIRRLAVRALGRFEKPALVFGITPLLADSNPLVRAEAANAIGQAVYRGEATMVSGPMLARLIGERDPMVRGVIAETMGRLPYRLADEIRTAETAIGSVASDTALAAVYGAARGLESLIRRNNNNAPPTAATVSLLRGLFVNRVATDTLSIRIRRLALAALVAANRLDAEMAMAALRDPDPEIRRLAAGSNLAADSLTNVLIATLTADPSPPVRYDALRAFGRRRQATDGCAVVIGALRDTSAHVVLQALDLMGNGCGKRAGDGVPGLLASEARRLRAAVADTGWQRPAHAMVSLARVAPDTAARLMTVFSRHASWWVRMYAARAAASTHDSVTLRRLAADPHDNVREAAVDGLVAVEAHGADSVYLAQLSRKDYQLLLTAARALDASADTNAAPIILASLRRVTAERPETARDARRALLERWAQLARREQVEGVLRGFLTDYDTLIARQAADLLSTRFGVTLRPSPRALPRTPAPSPAELAALEPATVVIRIRGGGEFALRLRPFDAPTNVARFARLARSGYFNNLTFHRIAPNFVVQGGSPGANEYWGDGPYSRDEVTVEPHVRSTIGVSTRGRDTGDGQLFVNLVDNWRLDHNYTIIGEVITGMDVVDRMLEGAVIERIDFR